MHDSKTQAIVSDGDNDDAPDIPPALSAKEWRQRRTHRETTSHAIELAVETDTADQPLLVIRNPKDGSFVGFGDGADLCALVALANDALGRCDHPAAWTREQVDALRAAAQLIDDHTPRSESYAVAAERYHAAFDALNDVADALESYLPPVEAKASK